MQNKHFLGIGGPGGRKPVQNKHFGGIWGLEAENLCKHYSFGGHPSLETLFFLDSAGVDSALFLSQLFFPQSQEQKNVFHNLAP